MSLSPPFKWRHFTAEMVLCAVRWHLRYALSYRDVEGLMRERGVAVGHTTVFRWVQCYAPELDKRCRPHLKATHNSYRVDETCVKVKQQWYSLCWAVDSIGATFECMLSTTRNAEAAERFFRKVLAACHTTAPRVITVDRNPAHPPTFAAPQGGRRLPERCIMRPCKYLNNVVGQDHRCVKRRVNPGLGCGAFHTAQRTIQGYETMHKLRKGRIEGMAKRDILAQTRVINQLFRAGSMMRAHPTSSHAPIGFCNTTAFCPLLLCRRSEP
jgi:IS6 family transposase